MMKRMIAIFVFIIFSPMLLYAGSNQTMILLIAKVKPKMYFTEINYTKTAEIVNKWILTDKYERVIGQAGPTYMKNLKLYQVYFINADRIKNIEIIEATFKDKTSELELDAIIILTNNIFQWLDKNDYKPSITEEII